jgi:hypothetical protein
LGGSFSNSNKSFGTTFQPDRSPGFSFSAIGDSVSQSITFPAGLVLVASSPKAVSPIAVNQAAANEPFLSLLPTPNAFINCVR